MPNPSIVQSTAFSATGAAVSFGSSVTAGNAIVVVQYSFSATTVPSDNKTGNTYTRKNSDAVDTNSNHVGIWACSSVVNGGTSFQVNNAGGNGFIAHEVKDFDAGLFDGNAFTKTMTATSGAGTLTSNSITITNPGALVIWGTIDQNNDTWTVNGSSVQDSNNTFSGVKTLAAHLSNANNGDTVQAGFAGTTNNTAAMIGVVIKAAVSSSKTLLTLGAG